MDNTQSLIRAFAKEVSFQMVVCREVDGGERDVSEKAGTGSFIQAHQAEVFDDPHCRTFFEAGGGGFGYFALHLETDLYDFERVGEDLRNNLVGRFLFNV